MLQPIEGVVLAVDWISPGAEGFVATPAVGAEDLHDLFHEPGQGNAAPHLPVSNQGASFFGVPQKDEWNHPGFGSHPGYSCDAGDAPGLTEKERPMTLTLTLLRSPDAVPPQTRSGVRRRISDRPRCRE